MIELLGLLAAIVAAIIFENERIRLAMYEKYVYTCAFLGEIYRRFM